jgi:hypothetical protein
MAFDYSSFVREIDDREKRIRENTYQMVDWRKLFAQDAAIFQQLYPEYDEVFAKPHRCTYYHKEATDAIGHTGHFSTTMVRLVPFKNIGEFIEYFGGTPNLVAEYIVNGDFLPLIDDPKQYLDKEVQAVYEPLFKRMCLADKPKIPAYKNRLEDALARKYKKCETWEQLAAEETSKIRNRISISKVKVGRLTYTDPARFFGERIAWLELFRIPNMARTIQDMMSWNVEKAAQVAYTCDFLITGTITKDRKTQTICAWNFDLNYFRETAAALLEYKRQKRRSTALMYLATNLAKLFKGIRVSRQDLQQEPSTPQFIGHDEKARYEILEIRHKEGLDPARDRCSDIRSQYVQSIKQGSIEEIVKDQELYGEYLHEFREMCKGAFFRRKDITLDFAKVAVAPSMGLSALLTHHLNPALGHLLVELMLHAHHEVQLFTDLYLPTRLEDLEKARYPILAYDYVPTFHLWAVPALPSPEM